MTTGTEVETLIIGGGQAGLAVSYFLKQAGLEHLIIDSAEKVAHAWRDDRWDSFTLVTPNWAFQLNLVVSWDIAY
jgi:putative flavoprotein involved in K+ transport